MRSVPAGMVDAFVKACRGVAARGLVRCSSGNLSLRIGGGRMLIKASRRWMERLTPRDVSVCRIADGRLLEGGKPSVEIGFHSGILRSRPDVNAVLHFQSTCATTLACRKAAPDYFVIPEIPFYIGPVAAVPYLPPGSKELAAAVVRALRTRDLAVLGHHGQVTAGRDLDHVIQNAEFFEFACRIIVMGGASAAPLPARAARRLMALGRAESEGKV